jgi:hypothetical protein
VSITEANILDAKSFSSGIPFLLKGNISENKNPCTPLAILANLQ